MENDNLKYDFPRIYWQHSESRILGIDKRATIMERKSTSRHLLDRWKRYRFKSSTETRQHE